MRHSRLISNFFCIIFIFMLGVGLFCLTAAEASSAKFIRIKGSSLGGSWFAGGAAWAKLISDNYPEYIGINIASPGLDNESIKRINRREAELTFLTGIGAFEGYKGMPPTFEKPQSISGLFGIWSNTVCVVVMADSKFKVMQDLKGASIATYIKGDVNGTQVLRLLKHHGITEKNTKFYRIMKADASRMFIDKRLDCIIYQFSHGHANLKEIASSRKVKFLPPDPVKGKAFMEENPFYFIQEFGKSFGIPSEKQLFNPSLAACGAYLPVDMIYKLVKVWFENLDWLREVLPSHIPYQDVKNPRAGVPIPLHPGAEKYFTEAGIIK